MSEVKLKASEVSVKAAIAREISAFLGGLSANEKNNALHQIKNELLENCDYLLEENKKDISKGEEKGLSKAVLDRIILTEERIKGMAEGISQLTEMDDPVGKITEKWERPNGLVIKKIKVPLGVIGLIYEARPNVTVDASTLCLKTGNAVILRGSSSALHSNIALVKVIQNALKSSGLPEKSVQLIEDTSYEAAEELFKMKEHIDVLIPRGGKELIKTVVEKATVPVLETGAGNCHIYIDKSADPDTAVKIAVNAKTQRPSVCNAAESILIHSEFPREQVARLITSLQNKGVEVRGDEKVSAAVPSVVPATEEDWAKEYLDLVVSVKISESIDEAIEHIQTYGSRHSEAIISEDDSQVQKFFTFVDASALYHNASTRFTDGFEFGFGAEIGISTQKLHARGPMGLDALTSEKYIILGNGQIKE
ncbi:glutamate-5-semialdehyde dehydrogenase [Evansella clarkii]|uniref:glutamate-5-semialdehyde dehydrogenase n=1 Tax=Evansella clarkii TaxID=79879 RepID=UPI0009969B3B|nr:glutamate-5-semialdehyde dehydrogenase [Evansella clarkii]